LQAVILCGGKGTRLREETVNKPKPLVPIGRHPILWHIMKIYTAYGVNNFILCLGYKGNMIKDYFLSFPEHESNFTLDMNRRDKNIIFHNPAWEPWKITFVETGADTNTGGRLYRVKDFIEGQRFFLTYGDGISNVHLNQLLEFHLSKKKVATLTAVHPPSPFGLMNAQNGVAVGFKEKPLMEGLVNGGFFVFEREIFNYLSADCTLEKDSITSLVRDGQLGVYEHRGFWRGMDTYKQVEELNKMWHESKAPWKVW